MKRKRHTEEQIIAILKEHEAGMKTADLCRKRKISEGCFYNLKAKYGDRRGIAPAVDSRFGFSLRLGRIATRKVSPSRTSFSSPGSRLGQYSLAVESDADHISPMKWSILSPKRPKNAAGPFQALLKMPASVGSAELEAAMDLDALERAKAEGPMALTALATRPSERLKGLENENAKLDIGSRLMAALLFTCPSTHLKTPIGITRTFKSLRTTWSQNPKLRCPLCGQTHEMRDRLRPTRLPPMRLRGHLRFARAACSLLCKPK
jgi:Transposase